MPLFYLERIRWKVRLCQKYNILQDGDLVLELGTGWVHWEALTLSLFWNVRAVLYDVCDNRGFSALQSFLRQVLAAFDRGYKVEGVDMDRARWVITQVFRMSTFDELYKALNYRYVVDPSGSLKLVEPTDFRLVVSAGVFEHIHREALPSFTAQWVRLMAPGSYAIHGINIRDHFTQYDRTVSEKQYLTFSDPLWRLFFQNELQYINRVQSCEWLELFRKAGLITCEENRENADLTGLRINTFYSQLPFDDLACAQLEVVLQKPHG